MTARPIAALVTGVPGWLGSRLVTALLDGLPGLAAPAPVPAGSAIRCLVRSRRQAARLARPDDRLQTVVGDLRDPAALHALCRGASGTVLFHGAGVIHPAWCTREFVDVNVRGGARLLLAAEANRIRRIVVVSSSAAVGASRDVDTVFDETTPPRPSTGYGRSKIALEALTRAARARGRLEAVIVRAPWFYGPEQPPRQTLFFSLIQRGRWPLIGDGRNRRSLAYVDNLCLGLLLAATVPDADGETYWIADRRPYAMTEIVDTVARLLETEFARPVIHRRWRLPAVIGELATVADAALQRVGVYDSRLHVLSELGKTIACSIDKAQRQLGYAPPIALEEGMRRSLAWCLARGEL